LAWRIEFTDSALKKLRKMDRPTAQKITHYLRDRVADSTHPRILGKALKGELRQYWRYRIGDYRVICTLQDDAMRVLVVDLAHRKHVYREP